MKRIQGLLLRVFVVSLFVVPESLSSAQGVDAKLYTGMRWRSIGPFRGGRSVACVGVKARPNEFYFGATGGGVWKSTNSGEDWACVSDGFFNTASVGALAVSDSNPDIVYAGTGEGCIRGNISHGDGIYKSVDAGKTWKNAGLADTQTITRIRIHPTNPDIVYVAALGHIYGPNPERGVFKTTDGGATWQKVLYVSNRAGAVDLSMDPSNPEVLYAATWEAWRTPFTLNSGGPGSRLMKTTDGGRSWINLSKNPGMPKGVLGRIGVSVSPAKPNRVFACIEALDGGVFRSDDGGSTWTLTTDNRNYRQRAWYYTHIFADPKDPESVYVLNTGAYKSSDAGATFTSLSSPHGDNHDLWINPDNTKIMINSNDGGATVTTDGGSAWTEQDIPTAQFYHVTTDNAFPYRIYGAQQDNSTVRIASRTFGGGIGRNDWTSTAGGESGYIAVKPDDPDLVFGGNYSGVIEMQNHRTGESRDVNAWPDNPMGHGAEDLKHRFQWTFPIVFSPHDPNTLYTCSQYLLKSTNLGQAWKQISPDLTRNDKSKMGPSGGPITKDNTSVEYYGTIFTVAESPVSAGVIWCGSDDGLVHVSRDGGANWTNVTPKGAPDWGLCSMIEASPHDPGVAYLAMDNHESDDFEPYIYRTRDYGKTWVRAAWGIPKNEFVRVVREDPVKRGLLYAGTEKGVWVSFDEGSNWQPLQLNLPLTPVHDLAIKNGDLIAATHGRSFWVLDDVSPLRQIATLTQDTKAYLFPVPDAFRVSGGGGFGGGRRGGVRENLGMNAPRGVVVSYYLAQAATDLKFEILDSAGKIVDTQTASPTGKEAGFHRTILNARYPSYRGFPGMILWAAGSSPIAAPPGIYMVRMTADSAVLSSPLRFLKDPRSSTSDADLAAQFELAMRIVAKTNEANEAVVSIRDLKKKIDESVTESKDDSTVTRTARALQEKLSGPEEEIYQVKNKSGQDPLNYPIKLNNRLAALLGVVLGGDFRPTDQSYEVFTELSDELQVQLDRLQAILQKDLLEFNKLLASKNLKQVVLEVKTTP